MKTILRITRTLSLLGLVFAGACSHATDAAQPVPPVAVGEDPTTALPVPARELRPDGCPAVVSCGGSCANTEEGKACSYREGCESELGRVLQCSCERDARFEAPHPYVWRLKAHCDCPKIAGEVAACEEATR